MLRCCPTKSTTKFKTLSCPQPPRPSGAIWFKKRQKMWASSLFVRGFCGSPTWFGHIGLSGLSAGWLATLSSCAADSVASSASQGLEQRPRLILMQRVKFISRIRDYVYWKKYFFTEWTVYNYLRAVETTLNTRRCLYLPSVLVLKNPNTSYRIRIIDIKI